MVPNREEKLQNRILIGIIEDRKEGHINEPTLKYRLDAWVDYCAGKYDLAQLNQAYSSYLYGFYLTSSR